MRSHRSIAISTRVLLAAVLLGCGKDGVSGSDGTRGLAAEDATVAVGELARFKYQSAGLTATSFPGSFGGIETSFGRIDDSTLAIVVPEMDAGDKAVIVEINGISARTTVAVTPAVTVADPMGRIVAELDAAEAVIAQPRPATFGATWATDSQFVAQQLDAARDALNQLSEADRLEVARLLIGLESSASTSLAPPHQPVFATSRAAEDVACATNLVDGERAVRLGKGAAFLAATVNSAWKRVVFRVFSVKEAIKAALAVGGVGTFCTMEQDFDFSRQEPVATTERPVHDATEVDLTAARRLLSDADDAVTNVVVMLRKRMRYNISLFYANLKSLFTSAGEAFGLSDPPASPAPVVVAEDVPVEPERVALETLEITAQDGSKVRLSLIRRGATNAIKVLTTLKKNITANLTFRITRPQFADQVVTRPVTFSRVCYDDGIPFSGCVAKVEIDGRTELSVDETVAFTARAFDAEGAELHDRTFRWSSSDPTIASVDIHGNVKGVKLGGPVTITANSGPMAAPVRKTIAVTVKASLAGTYALKTVSGGPLPWLDSEDLDCEPDGSGCTVVGKWEIPSGQLVMRADGTFSLTYTYRYTDIQTGEVTSTLNSYACPCTYTSSGTAITFGILDSSGLIDYFSGTVSGTRITLEDQDRGEIFMFEKQ